MIRGIETAFPEAIFRREGDRFVDVIFRIEVMGQDERVQAFDLLSKRIQAFLLKYSEFYVSYASFGMNIRACTCLFCLYRRSDVGSTD